MKKWTRMLCAALAMIMVLSACGTPAETTTEAPTTAATTTEAPTTAPTEPAVVAKDGTYTAAVTGFNLTSQVPVTVEIKDGKVVE